MSALTTKIPPAVLMVPGILAVVYLSVQIVVGTASLIPGVRLAVLAVLICLWLAGLPILVVKRVNVAVLRTAWAHAPSESELAALDPAWRDVLERAGVDPDRYQLLLVDDDVPVSRDLGWHVVTVDADAVWTLDRRELSGALAQRLARQTSWVAPLLGVCLWLALPLVLFLCLGALVAFTVRSIGRAALSAAEDMNTEASAGCALVLIFVGLAVLVLALIIGLTLLIYVVIAVVVALVALWLARTADVATDAVAVKWGYQPELLAAFSKLDSANEPMRTWLRPVSTIAGTRSHLRAVRRLAPR